MHIAATAIELCLSSRSVCFPDSVSISMCVVAASSRHAVDIVSVQQCSSKRLIAVLLQLACKLHYQVWD